MLLNKPRALELLREHDLAAAIDDEDRIVAARDRVQPADADLGSRAGHVLRQDGESRCLGDQQIVAQFFLVRPEIGPDLGGAGGPLGGDR